jgi:hypothetical protein
MYAEADLLPLSGLQYLAFCERQWGLIHLEQQWEENRLTAEGRVLHRPWTTAWTKRATACEWCGRWRCALSAWG